VGPPINRHHIEISEPRFAFDGDGPDATEPGSGAVRGDGVAVSDEEVGSGESFHAVP